ncbi:MAG: ASCH domain-containing protein [Steroidobacteraceae bacterium]
MYLPEGPVRPSRLALDLFWRDARAANPGTTFPANYHVRWIGLDADSTQQIFELIRARDKTGTFTLPWIVERTDQPRPNVGDNIILIAFDGSPTLLVRLERIHEVKFGEVTADDIAVDGTPVRDLAVWKPLHTQYWNALLQPFGLTTSADMPIWVEAFAVVHDRESAATAS